MRALAPLLFVALLALPAGALAGDALALHPENPRYFIYRGQPTVLIGSGEHYGAVLNPDFDYRTYLETLAADGLNVTRLFVGSYVERPGDFGIARNTLAPAPGRALVPWGRSPETAVVEGVGLLPGDIPDAVDVVGDMERALLPSPAVMGREQRHLDDHARIAGCGDEGVEPVEVFAESYSRFNSEMYDGSCYQYVYQKVLCYEDALASGRVRL